MLKPILLALALLGTEGIDYNQKSTRHEHATTLALDDADTQTACTNTTTDSPGCSCYKANMKGHSRIWLDIFFTKSSASRLDLEVFTGPTSSGPWATMQSSSTATLPALLMENHDPYWDVSSQSGTAGFGVGFDAVAPFMRFCFVGTSSDPSDLVDLYEYRF